jgi:hypothetical protein
VSEWNLSVRLTGQGSNLSRTLRDTARDARTASRDVNALRRDIDYLRRDARNGVRVRARLDATRLRADLRSELAAASRSTDLQLRLAPGAGLRLRREVSSAVRLATRGQRIVVPLGLANPGSLRQDVSRAVRRAQQNQTIRIRVTADTTALRGLGGSAGGRGGGGIGGLGSIMTLAPAVIPLLAGLSSNLAPLAGQFAAAGGAAGVFGLAVAGQAGRISEAAEAEQAYQDAVREHGRASAEASQAQLLYQQRLAMLPPEAQKAAVALSRLKDTFADWSDDMSAFTMQPVTKGFTVLEELLPHLSPEVESFSSELDRLMDVAGGAMATPGFDAFSDKVARLTDRQLDAFTDEVIHLMRVLSEGQATDGVLGSLLDYARQNGPEAREAIQAIGKAIMVLAEGASEAGPTMLTLVTAAARLVSALPPELVGIIIQVATALKLLQLSGAGFAALAGGLATVRTRIAAVGTTATAAGGGLAGLRAAFLALGTAAKASVVVAALAAVVVAAQQLGEIGQETPPNVEKLTTSLGKLGHTGKVTGEAARLFGKDLGDLYDTVRNITDPSTADQIQNGLVKVFSLGLADSTPSQNAREALDSIDEGLTNLVKNGKADLAAAAFERMKSAYAKGGKDVSEFTGQMDGYQSALEDVAFEQELAAAAMGIFGKAATDTKTKLDAQKTAADGLRASIVALNDVNRSAYDAQINFEQAVDDLTKSFKENGNTLDIHTEAGRKNGQAMSAAAKAQDEMIASGLAAGESLGSMTRKSGELRESMLRLATDAFDGNKKKAQDYVNTLLGTPSEIKTLIKLEKEAAISGLQSVQAEIDKTPGAKQVKVDTLNAAAIAALEAVGLKTKQLPDGKTAVYTANGKALGSIGAVNEALNNLDGRSVSSTATVTTIYRTLHEGVKGTAGSLAEALRKQARNARKNKQADGSVLDFYADGGILSTRLDRFANGSENHVAQIAPAGSWRVWAEPETDGEGYVPFARSKRVRSRLITEQIVGRLGGDPSSIQWNADGSVTDWRYDPQTGSLYSSSDAGSAGRKTRKVKVKGKVREVEYFDVGAVERKLKSAGKATQAWNKDLERVADRVGGDVAEALAAMGEDGVKLADKMAKGSTKYINEMAAALRNLQKTAKVSLTDYTRQLDRANKLDKDFAANLAKLAAQGFGDLASQLAAQNDQAAMDLAAAAVKDKGKADKANKAAKSANAALTADQVSQLVSVIAAIRTSKTGIHDVAATTGLGEDDIIDVASKATGQIKSALGSRATRFLADLGKAQKGLAYANGGIRAGMYATQAGIIRFAEPSTHGEAYVPFAPSKRGAATAVLGDVASRFGLGLTPANAGPSSVVNNYNTSQSVTSNVSGVGNAAEVARRVSDHDAYQLRRLARGGVGARG